MRKTVLFFVLLISLFAYVDSDFDGVEDEADKCPNTPFDILVDLDGCPLKMAKDGYFDAIVGIGYADTQSGFTGLFETNYYVKLQ